MMSRSGKRARALAMAPMSTNRVDDRGHVTRPLIAFLLKRALGGCGVLFVESATVDSRLGSAGRTLCIDDDDSVPGLRSLVVALRPTGALVVAILRAPSRPTALFAAVRPM